MLRPGNYVPGTPGYGVYQGTLESGQQYAVINLQGRVFMASSDDPFRAADRLLEQVSSRVILVDFHAEATSEKAALGWYLDGRVTAVLGTHTHVPSADDRVLPGGTAFQTDVGMSGPWESVIGVEREQVLHRFLTGMPAKFDQAKGDPRMSATMIECDGGERAGVGDEAVPDGGVTTCGGADCAWRRGVVVVQAIHLAERRPLNRVKDLRSG